jgi:hypothetical protein
MQLTRNFTLEEFNFRGYELSDEQVENARKLAENLQVVRDYLCKKVKVTSWFRPAAKNEMLLRAK